MDGGRYLVVMADDFGMGPATSRGILDLAVRGLVTSAVLLVNSHHAESSVRAWRERGMPFELGWHACLTFDRPISHPGAIPSLVEADGRFLSLGRLMGRVFRGQVREDDIERELRAQLERFRAIVGDTPTVVNTHHHVQVFPPVGRALVRVLEQAGGEKPYVRRVIEPLATIARVPGARLKRGFLTSLGRADARRLAKRGFPGNDALMGITNPRDTNDEQFLTRWLACAAGRTLELTCHPGHADETLRGIPGEDENERFGRRVAELERLSDPRFLEMCARLGIVLVEPRLITRRSAWGRVRDAA